MAGNYPLTFDTQRAFLPRGRVSLVPQRGDWRSLNPFLNQGFPYFCSCRGYYLDYCRDYYLDYCRDYYLKVFTGGKDWLFTLFLLLLPFWRANRRLIVNALTGAHLSLISGNANMRLVLSIQSEAHLFEPHEL